MDEEVYLTVERKVGNLDGARAFEEGLWHPHDEAIVMNNNSGVTMFF